MPSSFGCGVSVLASSAMLAPSARRAQRDREADAAAAARHQDGLAGEAVAEAVEVSCVSSGRTACGMPRRRPRRGASTRRCRSGRRSRRASSARFSLERAVRADADEALGLAEGRRGVLEPERARPARRAPATSAARHDLGDEAPVEGLGGTRACGPAAGAAARGADRSRRAAASRRRGRASGRCSRTCSRTSPSPTRRCSRRVSMRPEPAAGDGALHRGDDRLVREREGADAVVDHVGGRGDVASPPAPEVAIATTSPPAQKAGPAASRITAPTDASRGDLVGDVAPQRAHLEVHRVQVRRAVERHAGEARRRA